MLADEQFISSASTFRDVLLYKPFAFEDLIVPRVMRTRRLPVARYHVEPRAVSLLYLPMDPLSTPTVGYRVVGVQSL